MKNKYLFPKEKKGLSAVVATLLLVLLTLILVGIVWTVVSNLLEDKLDKSKSCMDVFNKVSLNDFYTCYNATSQELMFSINIGEINVEEVLVAISVGGVKKSLKILDVNSIIANLKPYQKTYSDPVKLPGENGGLTYVYDLTGGGFVGAPEKIELAPTIDGNQCDVSSTITEIAPCYGI